MCLLVGEAQRGTVAMIMGAPHLPVVTTGGVPFGRVWCEQSVWAVLSPV